MARLVSCRHTASFFFLVLLYAGNSLGAPADPPDYTYRSNPSEVRLTFSALDQNSHGVATLQASDFAVVDKDIIVRNFQSFTRSDWTKLEISVLVDTSESITPRFRQEIAEALELVSETAGVPDENLSVFSFRASQPAILCAEDCRASRAVEHLPVRSGGLTPLFDTVTFASDFLAKHGDPHAEKVLILFSDGEDTVSRHSLGDAIDAALDADVQIHCIDLNHRSLSLQGVSVLHNLANATGGRYFPAQDGATQAMNVILEGYRATYTVSYRLPSHASGFHDVRILPTHNLNLQFHCRSGYYYPHYIR